MSPSPSRLSVSPEPASARAETRVLGGSPVLTVSVAWSGPPAQAEARWKLPTQSRSLPDKEGTRKAWIDEIYRLVKLTGASWCRACLHPSRRSPRAFADLASAQSCPPTERHLGQLAYEICEPYSKTKPATCPPRRRVEADRPRIRISRGAVAPSPRSLPILSPWRTRRRGVSSPTAH